MNRLTEKSTNHDFYFPKKKVSILDLSAKLGKLEDLEEELGLPLEVVFEAFKNGIVFEHNVIHQTMISKSIRLFYFQSKWIIRAYVKYGNSENAYDRYLKDYQKTWWLPSDKEWKDE